MGVRISVSIERFRAALSKAVVEQGLKYRLREVQYIDQTALNLRANLLVQQLNREFDVSKAAGMLYLKRAAFNHESE